MSAKGIFHGVWDICSLGQPVLYQPDCLLRGPGTWSSWGWWPITRYTKVPASCQTWETELLVGFWFLFCLFAGCLFFLKKKKSVPLSTTFVAVCCSVHSGICPSNMCKPGGVALAEQHKSWCTHPVLQSGVASQDSLYTYRSNKYLCLFLTKTFLPYIRDGVDSAVQPPQAVLSPCQGKAGGGPLRCSAGGDTAERSP